MPTPPPLYAIAKTIGECVADGLTGSVGGVPDRVCVLVPGQIADDDCHCGQLAVSIGRRYPSRVFPAETVDDSNQQPCGVPYLVADITVSLMRCVPGPDGRGTAPTCEALDAAALIVEDDAERIRRAASCCLRQLDDESRILGWTVGAADTRGPAGGCVGTDLRIRVGVAHCACPDAGI